jgi:hypothetical protein
MQRQIGLHTARQAPASGRGSAACLRQRGAAGGGQGRPDAGQAALSGHWWAWVRWEQPWHEPLSLARLSTSSHGLLFASSRYLR